MGPCFLFDMDDSYAFDFDEAVTLELLFDQAATDGHILPQWNRTKAALDQSIDEVIDIYAKMRDSRP